MLYYYKSTNTDARGGFRRFPPYDPAVFAVGEEKEKEEEEEEVFIF